MPSGNLIIIARLDSIHESRFSLAPRTLPLNASLRTSLHLPPLNLPHINHTPDTVTRLHVRERLVNAG